ncbi:hypothetical protein BDV26DRAFT_289561 [Aspergillus bertholletiae]|uniref:Uncharacterized protein n=1 Tax=Aspergillus bertholletiae TaxID=1226010 RepID=A0A5N7BHS8_9EURO|nr:hypothetical protein BDV26DRAFT_289561 [Aspergillus bertholletiae]
MAHLYTRSSPTQQQQASRYDKSGLRVSVRPTQSQADCICRLVLWAARPEYEIKITNGPIIRGAPSNSLKVLLSKGTAKRGHICNDSPFRSQVRLCAARVMDVLRLRVGRSRWKQAYKAHTRRVYDSGSDPAVLSDDAWKVNTLEHYSVLEGSTAKYW